MYSNTIATLVLEDESGSGIITKQGTPIGDLEGHSLLGGHLRSASSIEDFFQSQLISEHGFTHGGKIKYEGIVGLYQYAVGDAWITNIAIKGKLPDEYLKDVTHQRKFDMFKPLFYTPYTQYNADMKHRTPEFHYVVSDSRMQETLASLNQLRFHATENSVYAGSQAVNQDEQTVTGVLTPYRDTFIFVESNRPTKKGKLQLIGGKIDHGESVFQGARRESLEEVGVALVPEGILGIQINRVGGKTYSNIACKAAELSEEGFNLLQIRKPNEIGAIHALDVREILHKIESGSFETPEIPELLIQNHIKRIKNPKRIPLIVL